MRPLMNAQVRTKVYALVRSCLEIGMTTRATVERVPASSACELGRHAGRCLRPAEPAGRTRSGSLEPLPGSLGRPRALNVPEVSQPPADTIVTELTVRGRDAGPGRFASRAEVPGHGPPDQADHVLRRVGRG